MSSSNKVVWLKNPPPAYFIIKNSKVHLVAQLIATNYSYPSFSCQKQANIFLHINLTWTHGLRLKS